MPALRDDHLEVPHPHRLPSTQRLRDEILSGHRASVAAGSPTYRDPLSGYQVFTAAYLAERGTCCDTGCRHCPYVGARSADSGPGAPGG